MTRFESLTYKGVETLFKLAASRLEEIKSLNDSLGDRGRSARDEARERYIEQLEELQFELKMRETK